MRGMSMSISTRRMHWRSVVRDENTHLVCSVPRLPDLRQLSHVCVDESRHVPSAFLGLDHARLFQDTASSSAPLGVPPPSQMNVATITT